MACAPPLPTVVVLVVALLRLLWQGSGRTPRRWWRRRMIRWSARGEGGFAGRGRRRRRLPPGRGRGGGGVGRRSPRSSRSRCFSSCGSCAPKERGRMRERQQRRRWRLSRPFRDDDDERQRTGRREGVCCASRAQRESEEEQQGRPAIKMGATRVF